MKVIKDAQLKVRDCKVGEVVTFHKSDSAYLIAHYDGSDYANALTLGVNADPCLLHMNKPIETRYTIEEIKLKRI